MTSCTLFNKMSIKTPNGPPSESQSEISSVDSDWSDIRTIALKLGVQNPDDLQTERFKVDRQKLENLFKTDSVVEGWNNAEYFFDNVMKNTTTYISWPYRLKIGAKTKKDPHVRIVGKPDDVIRAKECILGSLDARGTRVIMKMDVSYTDHSYIIGRCGNNIKRIMEDTVTHIHFPDSNRCNPTEKSNQVSLCGSMEGVEKARALVRLSTPLLISFELPIMAPGRSIPDHDTPYIKDVEVQFNVQIIFSNRPKLHSSLVLVKGSEKEAQKVKEATQALISFTCEDIANQILVHMQLEISPQHHEIVKGKNNTNLLNIMERTKTKIIFPDVHDMNLKPIKKSQVIITGSIDGVYRAKQQLIGNLPVALIFDYPDSFTDTSEIVNLSNKYGVFISLRQKQRQSAMSIVIKGVEKFIDKVYEARHEILNLNVPIIKPEIPTTYFSIKDQYLDMVHNHNLAALLSKYPESPMAPGFQLNNNNLTPTNFMSPYNNLQSYQELTPTGTPNQKYIQMHNTISNNNNSINNNNNYIRTQQHSMTFAGNTNLGGGNCGVAGSGGNANNNNHHNHNNYLQVPSSSQLSSQSLSPRINSNNTSGYQSFSSSTTSLEQAYAPYITGGTLSAAAAASSSSSSRNHYSPDSTINSNDGNNNMGNFKSGRRLSDGVMQNSNEYRRHFEMKHQQQRAFDFDMKRVDGLKAMERSPNIGEIRIPNSNWIGLALSRTSPAPLETVDDMTGWNRNNGMGGTPPGLTAVASANNNNGIINKNISPYNMGATTGLVDSIPSNRRMQLSHYKDIHSMLTGLGLEHYIKTFVLNEIDLEMFTSLTEDNLVELGITAFGARKKLLVAINTLAAQYDSRNPNNSSRFSGSAAPGAERRIVNGW